MTSSFVFHYLTGNGLVGLYLVTVTLMAVTITLLSPLVDIIDIMNIGRHVDGMQGVVGREASLLTVKHAHDALAVLVESDRVAVTAQARPARLGRTEEAAEGRVRPGPS